eukprot:TRINITY_DN140_c0_g1_i2.p2 TRINITY_DN140_c0_g1~~TRINITY_DN140_c0_g1_i2.p2  ORF type:complete len:196 (+),score=-11.97 TRINITY_DN140_c0_g1_i2:339-926(+)
MCANFLQTTSYSLKHLHIPTIQHMIINNFFYLLHNGYNKELHERKYIQHGLEKIQPHQRWQKLIPNFRKSRQYQYAIVATIQHMFTHFYLQYMQQNIRKITQQDQMVKMLISKINHKQYQALPLYGSVFFSEILLISCPSLCPLRYIHTCWQVWNIFGAGISFSSQPKQVLQQQPANAHLVLNQPHVPNSAASRI